ncbi:hypothetical protein [Polaribacter sp. R77954]|uniref:hypothetical protein n=1 Tax=Polaribacter sp. R77954 TaxID=3093870 RepID=UPI0037C9FCE2
MGGLSSLAPIDESVGILNKLNSNALEEFRNQNPEFSEILELGVIGGESQMSLDELKIRIKVSQISLQETLKETKIKYLPYFRKKIKRLQTLELWSQIIVVVTSSTTIGLLSTNKEFDGKEIVTIVSAVLSLLGAIFSVSVNLNTGKSETGKKNVSKMFNDLITHRIEAEETLREINIKSNFITENESELIKLIESCNKTNRDIRTIIDTTILN